MHASMKRISIVLGLAAACALLSLANLPALAFTILHGYANNERTGENPDEAFLQRNAESYLMQQDQFLQKPGGASAREPSSLYSAREELVLGNFEHGRNAFARYFGLRHLAVELLFFSLASVRHSGEEEGNSSNYFMQATEAAFRFLLGFVYYFIGSFWAASDNHEDAIKAYNLALKLDGDAEIIFARGVSRFRLDDYAGAIDDFSSVIAVAPDTAEAYINRGLAYQNTGESQRAMADYNRSISVDPDNVHAYIMRGNAMKDKGDVDSAIADYTQAIDADPQHSHSYYLRGLAQQDKSDMENAIADFTRSIVLDNEYAEAYCARGLAMELKGDLESAIADYSSAIVHYRNMPHDEAHAYIKRGKARTSLGDYAGAIDDFDRSIKRDPHQEAYLHRGKAKEARGDKQGAEDDYQRAAELNIPAP